MCSCIGASAVLVLCVAGLAFILKRMKRLAKIKAMAPD